jgi:hypothetical protein
MDSSNSSPAEKSYACAYIVFLAGIFSWYADSSISALGTGFLRKIALKESVNVLQLSSKLVLEARK